mgnify:CR=1 FL=1
MAAIFGVFGASGFGREVMPLVRASVDRAITDYVFVDDNPAAQELNGHRVLTFQEFIKSRAEKRMIVAIADPKVRRILEERCTNDGINIGKITAENTVIMDRVQIGAGAILCPFVTLTSNIKIGKSFHANIYSYVAHDCIIGDYVTFAPSVKCNGNVHIEDNA